MTKKFIQGEDYQLIGCPICVCTYRKDGFGYGTNKDGVKHDMIYMGDPSKWIPLEKVSNDDSDFIEVLVVEVPVNDQKTPLKSVSDDIRTFASGANRNSDEGKLDFEGFLSPAVIKKYAEYMHKNRFLENGQMRDSDNWQKGIPVPAYMKSMYRHFFDTWSNYRGIETPETQVQNLCGLMFNTMGMLHELLKAEKND